MVQQEITDNFFSCRQTPIQFTQANLTRVKESATCGTCKVRLTSLIAGTGHLVPTPQGLSFDSPQTSLEFNGVRHSTYGCLLSIPAMHTINITGMKYADISGAELHVQFRGETTATTNSYYTLVIPIQIGKGIGTDFFSSLGVLQRSRATLGSILSQDTPLILYKGTSLEGRTKSAKTACSNAVNKVNYLVALKPVYMLATDLSRFKTLLAKEAVYKGPVVATEPVPDNKLALISYIPSLTITKSKVKKAAADGYEETAQVKCRPLDRSRDIKGSKVFVGGPGQYRTLKDELSAADNAMKGLEEPDATTDVSRIETILAIVLGVLLGVVFFSVIAWFWFTKSESKYKKNSLLYAVSRLKEDLTDTNMETVKKLGTEVQKALSKAGSSATSAATNAAATV